MTTTTLAFRNTTFEIVDHQGLPWLRSPQIAEALEYSQPNRINDLYNRNSDEFTDQMTALVDLDTGGGKQTVRIFSLRGAHLLAMLARTTVAKDFRKWVLDILDRQNAPQPKPATLSHEQRKHLALTTRNFTHSDHWNPDQSLNFDAALQTISDFEKFLVVCDSHGLQTGNLAQRLLYTRQFLANYHSRLQHGAELVIQLARQVNVNAYPTRVNDRGVQF